MKFLTTLVIALTVSQPQPEAFQEADQRLRETWRSDRDRTMASVETSSRITPARKEILKRDVGEMSRAIASI
ncbi:hypothetical protein [Parendozoicomonas sp. Alg238-R29]|uniref:hypothetical protein n=1 Tax=Parendozoicomonas sp. Alg238-R29 TaxID=2993446 RepID=UPI00248D733B|nr:hypothetical protein [Parendozoicomonas sp. Alg238-R29]